MAITYLLYNTSWSLIFNASVSWVGYYKSTLGRCQCQLLSFCHFTPNLPFSILLCDDIDETFQTTFPRILCLLGLVGSAPAPSQIGSEEEGIFILFSCYSC